MCLRLDYLTRHADGTDVLGCSWGDARDPDSLWGHLRDLLNTPGPTLVPVRDFVFGEFIDSTSDITCGSIRSSNGDDDPVIKRLWSITLLAGTRPDICGHSSKRWRDEEMNLWWTLEVDLEYSLSGILRDAQIMENSSTVLPALDSTMIDLVEYRTFDSLRGHLNGLVVGGPMPYEPSDNLYGALLLAATCGRLATRDNEANLHYVLDDEGFLFGPDGHGWHVEQVRPMPAVQVLSTLGVPGLRDAWTLLLELCITADQGVVLGSERSIERVQSKVPWKTLAEGTYLCDMSWLDDMCQSNPGVGPARPKLLAVSHPGYVTALVKTGWEPPVDSHWQLVLVGSPLKGKPALQSMSSMLPRDVFKEFQSPYNGSPSPLFLCALQSQVNSLDKGTGATSYAVTARLLKASSTWVFCEEFVDSPSWSWYKILMTFCELPKAELPALVWTTTFAQAKDIIGV